MRVSPGLAFASLSITAALGWWCAQSGWFDGAWSPCSSRLATSSTHPSADRGREVDATDAERADALRSPVARESAAAANGEESHAAPLPPSGGIAIKVLDAGSGAVLESVAIRFLSERRFAQFDGGGDVKAQLTSGAWRGRVTSRGFEPLDLEPFEIRPGVATDLGTVRLLHGSGAIAGRVAARHLGANEPVTIELRGEGRAPCELCGRVAEEGKEKPVCCGYGEASNVLAVTGERGFSFGHLAAGVYWLRALDSERRLADATRVELGRNGNAWVELDVTAPTEATFELRDSGGLRFAGDWADPHHEQPCRIEYSFTLNDRVVGHASIEPTADDVRASIGPPPLADVVERESGGKSEASIWSRVSGGEVLRLAYSQVNFQFLERTSAVQALGRWISVRNGEVVLDSGSGNDDRIDRERKDEDTLDPEAPPPSIDPVELELVKLLPELHRIRPLPRELLTVKVSCGHWCSDEIPLDLRFGLVAPVVLSLHLDDEATKRLPELAKGPPASCAACHAQNQSGQVELNVGAEIVLSVLNDVDVAESAPAGN